MRLFIAVNFPEEIKKVLEDNAGYIMKRTESGVFPLSETYHITLAFLGETEPKRLEELKKAMDISFEPFTLTLADFGCFRRSGGNILWRGAESPELSELRKRLVRSLNSSRFSVDTGVFTPHITLAREAVYTGSVFPEAERASFVVTSFELMKSERINGRMKYTPLYSKEAKNV